MVEAEVAEAPAEADRGADRGDRGGRRVDFHASP